MKLKIENCFPKIYLYIYINQTNFENSTSNGEIEIDDIDDDGINLFFTSFNFNMLDDVCANIKAEDWQYCSKMNISQCGSNDSNICDKRCKWVGCNYVLNQILNNYSLCVPANLPSSIKKNDICSTTNIGKFLKKYFLSKKYFNY